MGTETLESKVHETEWDNLIVLDACRYDYFKHFYDSFPNLEDGELDMVRSPGSATPEVVPQVFTDYYDWQFFSGAIRFKSGDMPNVLGPWEEATKEVSSDGIAWHCSDHFSEIYDVWDRTDHTRPATPEQMVEAAISHVDPDKKSVFWFFQPHQPHIGTFSFDVYTPPVGPNIPDLLISDDGKVGKDTVKLTRLSYKYNLLRAFYNLYVLLGILDGVTAVTADHGELLFDDSRAPEDWEHTMDSDHDILRTVPWLVVDSDTSVDNNDLTDEEFLDIAYRSVLGRSIDDDGLQTYLEHLEYNMGRRELLEILIHSDEYKENVKDPNSICNIDGPSMYPSEEDLPTDTTKQRLRKLGYND